MDGPGMDGPGMDGPGMDGPGMDGPGMDGPGMDGPGMDGPGMDGPGMDGRHGRPGMDQGRSSPMTASLREVLFQLGLQRWEECVQEANFGDIDTAAGAKCAMAAAPPLSPLPSLLFALLHPSPRCRTDPITTRLRTDFRRLHFTRFASYWNVASWLLKGERGGQRCLELSGTSSLRASGLRPSSPR
eukprot:gene46307-36750_t